MVANVATSVIDNGLASLKSAARYIHITSQEATTHAEATSTYTKGVKDFGAGGVFPGAISAVTNGRRVTTAPFTNGSVTSSGAVTHWAITDGTNLLAAGPLGSGKLVTVGSLFGLGAFDIGNRYDLAPPAIALTATSLAASAAALGLPVLGGVGVVPLTATSLFTSPAAISAAILNGVGAFEPFITSKWLENYHPTVATPSNSYVSFGMPFRKGDIPTGSVPQAYLGDGTVIPQQYDLRSYHPDGSLRWCEVSIVAGAIAALGNMPVHFRRVAGSFSNTASRTIANVNAAGGHDYKIILTTLTDDLGNVLAGGTTTADFNTASAVSANTEVVKSGPVCVQWKTWMFFPGQQHLAAWFYVTAWTNPSGGALATISHIAKVHNGFLNVAGAGRFFYNTEYKDGASTIRKWGANGTYEKPFTYSGTPNLLNCTAHGFTEGQMVTVRSTGTLPPGTTIPVTVDAGTDIVTPVSGSLPWRGWFTATSMPGNVTASFPYSFQNSPSFLFAGNAVDTNRTVNITSNGSGVVVHDELLDGEAHTALVYFVQNVDVDHIRLSVAPGQVGTYISVTGFGSGTHFIVPKVFHQSHAEWFTADSDGRSDWTANEATVHVVHHREYLESTRLLPPYDLDITYNPNIDGTAGYGYSVRPAYSPLALGDLQTNPNQGGTRNTIAPIPSWCAMAFLTQDERWAKRSRINALLQPQYSCWIDEASGKIPPVCGPSALGLTGSWTGLGATKLTSYYYQGTNSRNVVVPTGGSPLSDSSGTPSEDFSHTPDCIHYTVLTEGGCHLIDAAIVFSVNSIFSQPDDGFSTDWYTLSNNKQRKKIANGNTYYGIHQSDQSRAVGWAWRSIGYARSVTPDNWPEAPYIDFLMSNNAAFAVDRITEMTATTNMTTMGWWTCSSQLISYAPFMHFYVMRSVAFMAFMTENANMIAWADYMAKLPRSIADVWRGHTMGALASFGYACNKSTLVNNKLNYVTAADFSFSTYLGFGGTNMFFVADAATDTFNLTGYGGFGQTYFPIAGDMVLRFGRANAVNGNPDPTLPDGFAFDTDYYPVNITGADGSWVIKLSASQGGAAKTFTSNGTCNDFYIAYASDPVGMPSQGDANSPNNSAFTEGYGCIAEVAQYGVNVGTAFKKAYTLAREAEAYSLTGVYEEFPNTPQWSIKPWYEGPGAIVFLDVEAAAGGNGTLALPYNNLHDAMDAESTTGRNLTGTGGLTFWCTGGYDELSTRCQKGGDCTNVDLNWGGGWTRGPGSSPFCFTAPSTADAVRIYGNPSTLKGRNFGPTFTTYHYAMKNTGSGGPGEPGGGAYFAVQGTGCVIFDGIQGYAAGSGTDGEAYYVAFNSTVPVIVRSNRIQIYQDGLFSPTGTGYGTAGGSIGSGPSQSLNLTFENTTFQCAHGYRQESVLRIAGNGSGDYSGAVINVVNCTAEGFHYLFSILGGWSGTVNTKNTAIFDLRVGAADGDAAALAQVFLGSPTVNFTNCATDSGAGSGPVTLGGATQWNANFRNVPGSTITIPSTFYYNLNFNDPPNTHVTYNLSLNQTVGDYSVKPGAAIIGAATATGLPAKDIVGRPRKTLTIGAWEP